jgi:hypothetical protein
MRNNTSQAPPFNQSKYQLGMLNFQHILDQINGCEEWIDDATKRVHVGFPDFYGKLNTHAFQDWLVLDDSFEWFSMSKYL